MKKIIIPIRPRSFEDGVRLLRRAEKDADLVEIWLDRLRPLTPEAIAQLIRSAKQRTIVNLKDPVEKGAFQKGPAARLELLSAAATAGACCIDLPLALGAAHIRRFKQLHEHALIVVSWHDFAGMPTLTRLRQLARRADAAGADVVKLVGTAKKMHDVYPILAMSRELADQNKHFIALAMGELGKVTRVLTPILGAWGTFAALDKKNATAPGQMTAAELKKWWKEFS